MEKSCTNSHIYFQNIELSNFNYATYVKENLFFISTLKALLMEDRLFSDIFYE